MNARRITCRTWVTTFIAVISVVIALLGVTIANPTARAADVPAPDDGYGFSQGAATQYLSAADVNRELDAVAKTHAQWLRVFIDWSSVEATKGSYDWTIPDRLVAAARARNLKVLALVTTTPTWARRAAAPGQLGIYAPPSDPATLGAFLQKVIARYDDVTRFEIWNEPNLPAFWGLTPSNPTEYTALLKAAYAAVKQKLPGTESTVVAAGMSPDAGAVDFVTKMYAAGAKSYFDAAAMHPYVFPGGISATPNGWTELQQIRGVMESYGDSAKRIWITEMGAPTRPTTTSDTTSSSGSTGSLGFGVNEMVSQQEQATQILDVLSAAKNSGYCGPAFIYSVRDWGTSANNREDNFGALLTNDWQPKYTASVLAR